MFFFGSGNDNDSHSHLENFSAPAPVVKSSSKIRFICYQECSPAPVGKSGFYE